MDESAEVPRLVNGLKVRSLSGLDVYVAGGEPDLVVPATPFGTYSISLDGSPDAELRANGSALPIHKLVGPEPTHHRLLINESHVLEFETIGIDDQSLITSFGEESKIPTDSDSAALDSWPERLVLARSANNFIVTRTGAIAKVIPPEIPVWLEAAGYDNGSRFDTDPPPDGLWLATTRREIVRSVKRLRLGDAELNLDSLEASLADWRPLFEDENLVRRSPEWINFVYQARRLLRI